MDGEINKVVMTVARLKNINIHLYGNKYTDVFDVIDRLTDEELEEMFKDKVKELYGEGRID